MKHTSGPLLLRTLLVLPLLCFTAFTVSAQSIISANPWVSTGSYGYSRQLVVVNPATGTLLAGRDVNLPTWSSDNWRVLAVATHPISGVIYAVIDDWGDPTWLATIDPVTGDATLISPTTEYMASIAFAADGTLYGIIGRSDNATNGGTLHTIDLSTGVATQVCTDPLDPLGDRPAIAFSSADGLLYHATGQYTPTFESLTPTDPCTQTDVPLTGYSLSNGIQGLLDLGGGTFLGADFDSLYTITTGGSVSYVAEYGFPGQDGYWEALHTFATTDETLPIRELRASQTASKSSMNPGETLVVTVSVLNDGSENATGVKTNTWLRSHLGLSYVSSSSADATCAVSTIGYPRVICDFGELAAGGIESAEVTLAVSFGSYSEVWIGSNITGGEWDAFPEDNEAWSVVTRNTTDVAVAAAPVGRMGKAGKPFTFHVVATNNGPGSAASVSVTTSVPGTTFSSSTYPGCTGWTCTLGTLTSGQTVEYDVIVLAGPGKTTMVNTTTISTSSYDPNSSNNSSTTASIKVVGKP